MMKMLDRFPRIKKEAIKMINNGEWHEQIITDTSNRAPVVFNRAGQPMHFFYLKDDVCTHNPYSFSSPEYSVTQHIVWDRYNKGLPIHFYSHDNIFYSYPYCNKKFGLLIESEAIVPSDYKNVYNKREVISEYTALFTHSYRLLERYPNAKFMPGSGVWYGSDAGGGAIDKEQYKKKTKNISLISSDKTMCDLHYYRKNMAFHYKKTGLVDTYGTFDGGAMIKVGDSLTDYRYSIAIENFISPYYFTEKIMNCFASMTIPIYVGATEIEKFFNIDGIIKIDVMDFSDLDKKIRRCCKEDYEERIEAVIDNFNRVQKYICYEDYLFEEYGDFILN